MFLKALSTSTLVEISRLSGLAEGGALVEELRTDRTQQHSSEGERRKEGGKQQQRRKARAHQVGLER